ncbi:hypothetical protein TcWFU_008971 [Taenia crassiceps]|uniref:ZP domain-containing protein n=1 Tax=Taenia crassiceps TaxID=6207 RepID=A0ABR4QT15_9CEST
MLSPLSIDPATGEKRESVKRCAKGQLLIQRMALLEETFLKPIPVAGPRDNHLRFNDRLGLLCPPPLAERVSVNHSRERPPVIIAVDLDDSLIHGPMELSEGVTIVASTMVKPVARSIFQVVSPGACPSECKVIYEAPVQFMLAGEGLSSAPLYMASDIVTSLGATNPKSGQRRVFMHADKQDYNTLWKFQHIDPQLRLEVEGLPVSVNTRIILRHCKTNSALAIEHSTTSGFFGREYEVSTCDHLDGHRVENDTNQFCAYIDFENWTSGTQGSAEIASKCSKRRECSSFPNQGNQLTM